MPAVDRNLLRMAVGEMIGFKGTPFPIVINEALEIGRRFSAPESINFLNGMLDQSPTACCRNKKRRDRSRALSKPPHSEVDSYCGLAGCPACAAGRFSRCCVPTSITSPIASGSSCCCGLALS